MDIDPVTSFFMRLDNEDKVVDHILMKQWEEKVEKAKDKINKLVECLVEMTGCSKKEAQNYACPGYHSLPNNVKLKEMRDERDHYHKEHEKRKSRNIKLTSKYSYMGDLADYLYEIAKRSEDWDQTLYNKTKEELREKYGVEG